jgi:hypothetical protein
MGTKIKIITGIFLILGVLLWLGTPAMADPTWLEGKVTDGPTKGQFRYLGVDNVRFTLSSQATIYERTTDGTGISQQDPLDFDRIRIGQNVLILHEGIRIFQIIVLR